MREETDGREAAPGIGPGCVFERRDFSGWRSGGILLAWEGSGRGVSRGLCSLVSVILSILANSLGLQ